MVITFLLRSKHLLISWLQSPSAVILEPPKLSLSLFPLFSERSRDPEKKWYLEFSVSISHQDTKGSCCYCCLLVKSCPTLLTPWTVACQGPPSMGLTRQEYWRGLPFLSSGHLPSPKIEHTSPALAGRDSLPLSHGGSLQKVRNYLNTEMRSVC